MTDPLVCPVLSAGTIHIISAGVTGFVPCIRGKCEIWNRDDLKCDLKK